MTRINCIPVNELTDKHLVAEYRELPRVFKMARDLEKWEKPDNYTMGTGHVKFFFDKLLYCQHRQEWLYEEMKRRGFNPQFDPKELLKYHTKEKDHLWKFWHPTAEAMKINRQRIKERLNK